MKIALLTEFNQLNPGFSLTGIVVDQYKMLKRYGHDVTLFVAEPAHYNDQYDAQWEGVEVTKAVPRGALVDYQSLQDVTDESKKLSGRIAQWLVNEMPKYDIAITHDWVFVGWDAVYAAALMMTADDTRDTQFLHFIHSLPAGQRDWWVASAYGKNHKFITPSYANRDIVIREYRCSEEEVRVVPHIKDIRTWFDFCEDTCDFIDDYPAVLQAKCVCVYPASSDRLRAKQVQHVIGVMGAIKRRNGSACLVIANQWSQGERQRVEMPVMEELAQVCGLKPGVDFIWTSDFKKPKFDHGITRRMVRELMLCANLFVFPTKQESFGLVAPEAALCGNYLVLNKDLDVLSEIFSYRGKYFHFSSFLRGFEPGEGWETYLDEVGGAILNRMQQEECIVTRTIARRTYNMDAIYLGYYEPLFLEVTRK